MGGSTILNGLCWTRGSEANFNAWEALGNPGWGWDDMQPYFRKVGLGRYFSTAPCVSMGRS